MAQETKANSSAQDLPRKQALSYREKNPGNNTLVFFVHGNSSSANIFNPVFESDLFDNYHLVAVDLPGHGNSPSWDQSHYSLTAMAYELAQLIRNQWPQKPLCMVGFSLGTNIVAEMLAHIKAAGIVLVSPSVLGSERGVNDVMNNAINVIPLFSDETSTTEVRNFFTACSHNAGSDTLDDLVNQHQKTAAGFRPGFIHSVMQGDFSDEIQLLKQSGLPILVIFGKQDSFSMIHYLDEIGLNVWRNEIQLIDDCGHFIPAESPEALIKLLHDYLHHQFRDNHAC
ncbi:alpha/beta fold hydrolase [Flavihumibacter sp. ZG627]|uniref:alpha/beta fold hydrolase n=1 Tax=Flavihumibacter sp. ZG627 TaxID=1463156 RepID=UPI00057FAAEE|nr:alpha/beta hydrolase [Flavihumibacter sp. ZG627]